MAARYTLDAKDKIQLLDWIGHRGRLVMIYSAQLHGCDSEVFHAKCDNMGPSVAVAISTAGYVFGGFTSRGWNAKKDSRYSDPQAFLFRLHNPKNSDPVKYPGKKPYIHSDPTHGPTFRGLHFPELRFWSGKLSKRRAVFLDCNIYINLNNEGFSNNGHNSEQFCGSDTNFYDFQVYQFIVNWSYYKASRVLQKDQSWRTLVDKWTNEVRDGLKEEIADYRPPEALGIQKVNILLIGPKGAGKSSFFNTINSVYRGYMTAQAATGTEKHSLTKKFRKYTVRSSYGGTSLPIRLCDTIGIEEDDGLKVNDIAYILDGNVPDRMKLNEEKHITPATDGFIASPSLADAIHVTAFVMSASEFESPQVLEKLTEIRSEITERDVPLVVLLTHVDQVCPKVAEDTSCVYKSDIILQAVEDTASAVGVPKSHVLPVKNYGSDAELETEADILALLALRQILYFADNFFYGQPSTDSEASATDQQLVKHENVHTTI